MINDVEHLFKYLLAVCISSSEKVYSGLLPILKLNLFFFFLTNMVSYKDTSLNKDTSHNRFRVLANTV